MTTQNILAFLAGLGLFIFGMHIMAEGIQKSADTKMKKLMEVLTKNKFIGVLVGTGVTAIVQSSSTTTVMVVGFVNAGLMNLSQAMSVIMGANIGTTVTGWISSSGEWAKFLKPDLFAPVFVFVGAFMVLLCKKEKLRLAGEIIIGFGILFIGMGQMSSSVSPLRESKAFKDIFVSFGSNPLLGILAGAVVTAIIQSSSASVGILQSVAAVGLVPFSSAVYIIMGQNIGTCVTALLSSIGTSKNAKAAAYMHLLFNIIGSVIFSIIAIIYFKFFNQVLATQQINKTEISIVHTSFNIANTILLYNFSNYIIKIAEKLTAHIKEPSDEVKVVYLDDRILESPTFAIQNCVKEIIRLGYITLESLKLSKEAIFTKNSENVDTIFKKENGIDYLEQEITNYLVKISKTNTTDEEHTLIAALFHTSNDIERVGDHCENIAEICAEMIQDDVSFSDEALKSLEEIFDISIICFESSIKAMETKSIELANQAVLYEDAIDHLQIKLKELHLKRLLNSECDSTTGVLFMDLLSNLERVGDHSLNIAEVVTTKKL